MSEKVDSNALDDRGVVFAQPWAQHLTSVLDSVCQLTTLFPESTYRVLHICIELLLCQLVSSKCLIVYL